MEMSNNSNSGHSEESDSETCPIFCQMAVLRPYNDDMIWKEVRRWVKFEEVLEEKGKRWSKPHVSSLHMQSLTELQFLLASNPILLDLEVTSMSDLSDILLERWRIEGFLEPLLWNHIRATLMKRHKHHYIRRKQIIRHESKRQISQILNLHDVDPCDSVPSSPELKRGPKDMKKEMSLPNFNDLQKCTDDLSFMEPSKKFLRKIPDGAEVCNILVGEVEDLKSTLCAFVRLDEARNLGNITEVPLPTKFVFVLLVPRDEIERALEIGRCVGTLMTDWIFREVAYSCDNKVDIMSAVQEFASQVTVLPPGCWDPKTRIDPPEILPLKEARKPEVSIDMSDDVAEDSHHDDTLKRSGRLFGGLFNDVKRKVKWYRSDFTDALHVQCFASTFYLFLATLTPNVAFGGLLGVATDQHMGTMECILSAAISGVIYALFSGQPLNILGSTGPMLVLEMILYNLCRDNGWDFMPARVWVGLWTAFFLLIIVAFDLSSLVRYITRFTEENFACLIALIFIYQAVAKTLSINSEYPLQLHPDDGKSSWQHNCSCVFRGRNQTMLNSNLRFHDDAHVSGHADIPFTSPVQERADPPVDPQSRWFGFELPAVTEKTTATMFTSTLASSANETSATTTLLNLSSSMDNCTSLGGVLVGDHCGAVRHVPDVFLFSILLFIGTAALAFSFIRFRDSLFCPTFVRQTVADFGVLLAIVVMVVIDLALGLPTPKLTVPSEFKPTRSDRGWFINPISSQNPWWLMVASAAPAMLGTILIFMDQQITSVIVNRKENKLKKGGGYHLDLLVVAILVIVLSLLGLPWYVAATVTAIAHVMSLKKVSECTAPGEKPVFLGVREQRVTSLFVGIFSGLAVLITSVLQHIPMPVLYGVFFFMGLSALNGMQLVDRVLIMFMPQKYQPDLKFLRHVPQTKVHLFTVIQVACLVILWVVKSFQAIAIFFPLMVVAICFIRKFIECIFSNHELKWLDDLLPQIRKKDKSSTAADKYPIISVSDISAAPRTKFKRSLSVPASVNTTFSSCSIATQPSNSCTELPFLQRARSNDSLTRSSELLGHAKQVSKRKLSLLSLPVNPSFVLDEDVDNFVDEQKRMSIFLKRKNSQTNV